MATATELEQYRLSILSLNNEDLIRECLKLFKAKQKLSAVRDEENKLKDELTIEVEHLSTASFWINHPQRKEEILDALSEECAHEIQRDRIRILGQSDGLHILSEGPILREYTNEKFLGTFGCLTIISLLCKILCFLSNGSASGNSSGKIHTKQNMFRSLVLLISNIYSFAFGSLFQTPLGWLLHLNLRTLTGSPLACDIIQKVIGGFPSSSVVVSSLKSLVSIQLDNFVFPVAYLLTKLIFVYDNIGFYTQKRSRSGLLSGYINPVYTWRVVHSFTMEGKPILEKMIECAPISWKSRKEIFESKTQEEMNDYYNLKTKHWEFMNQEVEGYILAMWEIVGTKELSHPDVTTVAQASTDTSASPLEAAPLVEFEIKVCEMCNTKFHMHHQVCICGTQLPKANQARRMAAGQIAEILTRVSQASRYKNIEPHSVIYNVNEDGEVASEQIKSGHQSEPHFSKEETMEEDKEGEEGIMEESGKDLGQESWTRQGYHHSCQQLPPLNQNPSCTKTKEFILKE